MMVIWEVEKYPGIVLANMVKMLSEILEYCNSREELDS
jgi:hypothetical protein